MPQPSTLNHEPSFLLLGGYGEMGRVTAHDLFETSKGTIVIAGHDEKKPRTFAKSFKSPRVKWAKVDIANQSQLIKLLRGKSVCINSTNYYFNLSVMKACLKARVPYLDLGGLFHMTKKQLKLHKQFKKAGLLAILGCGATPGITNVMAAHGASLLDRVQEIHVKFGGRDFTKYKTPFVLPYSAQTIFDEFTMKAVKIMHGKIKMIAPWSDSTVENFPKPVGKTLCGSVLHSELATFPKSFPGIRECSFQGGFGEDFVAFIKTLIAQGFAKEPYRTWTVEFLNKFMPEKVAPTSRRRINRLASLRLGLGMKMKDIEILRVTLFGIKNGKKKKVVVDCVAKSIPMWNAPAGTVDTGVPPSIIAQMIGGKIRAKGVLPPELCVEPEGFFRELRKRRMEVKVRIT